MAGLVDAVIDAAAEMLDEGAEQAAIGLADRKVTVEEHLHVTHRRDLQSQLEACGTAGAGWVGVGLRRPCVAISGERTDDLSRIE